MKNRNKILSVIVLLLILCTGISVSYAFFKISKSTQNPNITVNIDNVPACVSLQMTNANIVSITNEYAVPITDAKALSSDVYKTSFDVINNCDSSKDLTVLLAPTNSSTMPVNALKYALVEQSEVPSSGTLISDKLGLNNGTKLELKQKYNQDISIGYSVGSKTVPAKTTKSYNLYLWIDENEGGLGQNTTMNKLFEGYIVLGSGSLGNPIMPLYNTIQAKYNEGNTFVKLYDGEGSNTYANPVYYYNGAVEDNNVLFAGFCWKIVRTTDTGGVKLIYNGVQTDGSCNNTGEASQIGTSKFNSSINSPAYVGYMYNTVYTHSSKYSSALSNIVFGNSFTYSGGSYTLTDTMTVSTWPDGYNTINNNHYTCLTTGTSCSSLYYVYYTTSSNAYYITLTGGKSVSDALNEMLYADDVNKTNSTMKTYIETWYENNMTAYTSYLEDTIFCNDRSILNLNGWNPNGGDTTSFLQFKNSSTNYSLICGSVTDQFRVENSKAPLKYPVGLLIAPEVRLAYKDASYSTYYLNTGQDYWLGSPYHFYSNADGRRVSSTGSMNNNRVYYSYGARPSVSLKPGTMFVSGEGSYTLPYLIE